VPARRGGFILWVLVALVILAAGAAGLYYLQDKVLEHYAGLAKYYEMTGLLKDPVVGVGLSFRNLDSERLPQDNSEVLVVRAVISNDTTVSRTIPSLRLALYNGQALVQEKLFPPPKASLEAKASTGFIISLDQPDPNATRIEVTFDARKVEKK
jgi:hypothetical protein